MHFVFPHVALVCRVALVAMMAALWGADPAEAASGRAGCCRVGCCRVERKLDASCCCRPASTRSSTVAQATTTDAVQLPSCRCVPPESAPADRTGSAVTPDPPAERVAELGAALANSPESTGHHPVLHLTAKPSRTPLYLRLSRLRT